MSRRADAFAHSFVSRHALALVLAAVVLTRLPSIFSGYGADPDAWLVAGAASTLWHTGMYVQSRLPGYPLHELVSAPLVGVWGAQVSNAATLVAALCTLTVWWIIVRRYAQHLLALLLALAFAPVFWQHSAVTLDYVWSLLFVLGALYLALDKKFVLSGTMLGIAAGFRLPNLLMVLPLAVLMFAQHERGKSVRSLFFAAAFLTICAFVPLLIRYGGPFGWYESTRAEMSDLVFTWQERLQAFFYRSVYFLGPVASFVLLSICIAGRRTLKDSLRGHDPFVLSAVVAVAVYLGLFLWLPLDRAYLLPVLPFVLLFLDRIASHRGMVIFATGLIFHGLVNLDVVQREDGTKRFGFNIHAGVVIEEVRDRLLLLREREFYSTYPYPNHSIIMTGRGAFFWFENEKLRLLEGEQFKHIRALNGIPLHRVAVQINNPTVVFLPYLYKEERESFQQQRYAIFCTARAQPSIERLTGYTMRKSGVAVISPPRGTQ